jgi:DNA-binding MarR family transcriptional regulator
MERPTVPDNIETARLLQELMGLLHAVIAGDALAVMHDTGLTLPQIVALHVLHQRGDCTLSAVGDALRLSTSATSHLVDRLVERGLVNRWEDPADRRQKRLQITESGLTLTLHLATMRTAEMQAGLGLLDPATRAQLGSVLEEVVGQLRRLSRKTAPERP